MAPNNSPREVREARDRLRRYNARQAVHAHQLKRRRRDNIAAGAGLLLVATLATATQVFYFTAGPGMPTPVPSASPTPTAQAGTNVGEIPSPEAAESRTWSGQLTLNDIQLGIELDGVAAPQAVAAFVAQVDDGYFIDTTCHRLLITETAGLIQCGSIDGVGGADPAFSFGPIENAPADGLYPAGTIALARGADPYSQGHQFFIVFEDTQLDTSTGGYTVFGTVTSGLDRLVDEIAAGGIDPAATTPGDGPPVIPTAITDLTIE